MVKIKHNFYIFNPVLLKFHYVFGLVFVIFAFLPWVNFGTNSRDTQAWPLIFGTLFLLISLKESLNFKELSIFTLPILALIAWFFFSQNIMDFIALRAIINYLAFSVCFLAFTLFIKRYSFPWRLIISINILYIFVGLIQLYIPDIVSNIVTTRGLIDSSRGVTSLTSEPTFFGLFLFFLSFLYLVESNFKPKTNLVLLIFINVLSIFFLSKSSTVALFFLISIPFIFFTRFNFRLTFLISCSTLLIIFLIPYLLDGSRLLDLYELVKEIGIMQLIFLDQSINDRVANVIYPLHGFYLNNFLPGGFHSFSQMHIYLTDYYLGFFNFGSGSTSILSYIGAFVYELGFLGIIFLLWIFVLIQDGTITRFFDTTLLFILLNSSVPPSLPLIPFIFAVYLLKNNNLENYD